MDNKIYNKAYKKLIRRIIIASSLLLAIFFLKQFVIQDQINKEINTSYIINIAGRQRMLSQKITKNIVLIEDRNLNLKDDIYIKDLEASLKLWKESHEELQDLNKTKGFLGKENMGILRKFKDIEPSFYNMVHGAEGFLKAKKNRQGDKSQVDLYLNEVIENEEVFLKEMDSIVFLYEGEAMKSVENMKTTHMVLFILIIGILIFIGFRILIPLLKYVNNSFWKIRESNENLIKMFHTLKGALFVIKRNGEIVFMNSDAENIVSKEKKSNESLYLNTSIKWIGFDIKSLIEEVKNDDIRIDDIETTIKDKDENLMAVTMSAASGIHNGHEVVVLNLFDITPQKKAEEILKNAALKDKLTGLYNRHFLESIIEGEFKRAQRYNIPLSAALLDLDYFKKINDQWGHPIGDSILKLTADIVKNNIRKSDFPIRIGGEEFLILMPNTDSQGALAAAEKIRKVIEDTVHPTIGKFTASFGVTERRDEEEYKDLYERVDEALYLAKEKGRNRVKLVEKSIL